MPIRYERDFSDEINVVSANVVSVEAALSTRIDGVTGGAGSVTSNELSAVANASTTTSSPALSNAFSNDHSISAVIKTDIASVSAAIKTDIASVSAAIMADAASHLASASAAIMADAASHLASASAAIMVDVASHLTSTSALIKTDIASVSAAIMADVASHLTSTSALIKTDINSVSAAISTLIVNQIASASAAIMVDVASHLTSTSALIKTDIASVSAAIKTDIASVSAAISTLIVNQLASASAAIKTDAVSAINVLSNVASNMVSAAANASTTTSSPILSNAFSNDHSVSAVIKTDIASVSAAIMADVASHLTSTSALIKTDIASVSAAIKTDINSVSAAISAQFMSVLNALSARSAGNVSTKGMQSVLNALSNRISIGGAGLLTWTTQTDTDYTLVAGDANTGIKMNSSSAHNLTVPLNATVPYSLGTQIVIEQAGTGTVTIVATGGVTLQGASATVAQYSVIVLVKQATDTWLVANAAGDLASVSAVIKTDIASVSAVIKADIASYVTSTALAASTAGSIAALSVASVRYGVIGQGQLKAVAGAQAVVSTFPQLVSGLSLSIAANGIYQINGQIMWTQSTAGSASAIFQFGMSINQAPSHAAVRLMGNEHAVGALAAVSATTQYAGTGALCATPSIMYSVKASVAASGVPVNTMMFFDGIVVAGGSGGLLKCLVGASTTSNTGINVIAGSYIRAYKIG